jgi:hypothetical protein
MQFQKNPIFTAQETYHAHLAISTGNYETKLAKAIQRKLLNRMFNGPEKTIPCRPLLEYLDDESCVKFMRDDGGSATTGRVLEYLSQFGESAAAPLLTCQFVVIAAVFDSLDEEPSGDDGFELFIAEMKTAELAKHFTAEMACMIDVGTVAYFDCVESDIVELSDGNRTVTFNVVPVYAIH